VNCFRGENTQAGRWRQFTQFGVEILNPTKDYSEEMIQIEAKLVELVTKNYETNLDTTRGLDYYKNGKGFEISCPDLGSSSKYVVVDPMKEELDLLIGVDRLLMLKK
jgi:histidyl-tRNA synthetase